MGRAKAAMMEHDDNIGLATRYLVKVGKLDHCEIHGEVWDAGEGIDDFYPIAMGERKKGDRGLVPWAADMAAREFTDLIKEAYESHYGDGCGYCAKLMSDD